MKFLLFFLSLSAFAADHHHAPAKGPTGWEAYSQLQNGNMRFSEGKLAHPHQDVSRRDSLASGQQPHTIILSCSDSRLAPELVFDQGLGDVFVVRNAGNVVNAESIASIEYAIEHLGSKLLVVMGHESCGAVGAAIATKPGSSAGSASLDVLVKHVRGNLSATSVAAAASDKSLRPAVKENVTANLRELLQKSKIVREAVHKHGLVLAQAVYSLKTGRVDFWDVGQKFEGVIDDHVTTAIQEGHVESADIGHEAPAPEKKEKAKAQHH